MVSKGQFMVHNNYTKLLCNSSHKIRRKSGTKTLCENTKKIFIVRWFSETNLSASFGN